MRVLVVTNALFNGGAERQMALLAASLLPSHEVMVLSLEGGPFQEVLLELGVPVEILPRRFRYDVTPAVRMWRAASDFGPDVVHSWGWMSSAAMVPFCRYKRVPLVDGTIRTGRPPRTQLRERGIGIGMAEQVVANSRAGLVAWGISESRGRVVYNGFDTSRLSTVPDRVEPSRFPELTTVVMTARMFPEKDWPMLFRTARVLAEAEPGRWRFLAVGRGPDRDQLTREAADLVSDGVLEFPSGGIEVLPIVASANIGVLLTNTEVAEEGCSNSIMEYMACGLPVVCTDCGGNPELVAEGRTGYLIPPSDEAMLATRLRELRDDSAKARSMGSAGARRLEEAFTVQAMVDGFVRVYELAAGRRAVGRTPRE